MKKLSLSLLLSAATIGSALATVIPARRGVPTNTNSVPTVPPVAQNTEIKTVELVTEGPLVTYTPTEVKTTEPTTAPIVPIDTNAPAEVAVVPVKETTQMAEPVTTAPMVVEETPGLVTAPPTTTLAPVIVSAATAVAPVVEQPEPITVKPANNVQGAAVVTDDKVDFTKPTKFTEPDKEAKTPEELEKAFQKGFDKIKNRADKAIDEFRAKLMADYPTPEARVRALRKKQETLIRRYNESLRKLAEKHKIAGAAHDVTATTNFAEFFDKKIQDAIAKLR